MERDTDNGSTPQMPTPGEKKNWAINGWWHETSLSIRYISKVYQPGQGNRRWELSEDNEKVSPKR